MARYTEFMASQKASGRRSAMPSGNPHHVTGTFGYGIAGLPELQAVLMQLPKAYRRTPLTKALTAAAQPTLALARANVPRGMTGNLADSLHVSTQLNKNQRRGHRKIVEGAEVFIGSNAPHAHLVEFGTAERERDTIGGMYAHIQYPQSLGTGRMQANPFLTRAWDATKDTALKILRHQLWIETAKAVKRLRRRAERGTLSVKVMREMQRM